MLHRLAHLTHNIFGRSGHGRRLMDLGLVSTPLPLKLTSYSRSHKLVWQVTRTEKGWAKNWKWNMRGRTCPNVNFDGGHGWWQRFCGGGGDWGASVVNSGDIVLLATTVVLRMLVVVVLETMPVSVMTVVRGGKIAPIFVIVINLVARMQWSQIAWQLWHRGGCCWRYL